MHARKCSKFDDADALSETGAGYRLCAVSRADRPLEDLIRFVAGPDGAIVPDLARKLPGRGVWVSADAEAVAKACKTGVFARSLKAKVTVQPDLVDLVGELMTRRVTDALSLAKKAGLVTTGFTLVESLIGTGAVACLLHGADAADGGCQKLDRKLQAVAGATGKSAQVYTCLTTAQLSLALGRPNVVHAALTAGGATKRFLAEAGRHQRYRHGSFASGCTGDNDAVQPTGSNLDG